ncbi:MAG TPA: hypothetical protein VHA11_07395 [Bryobacteraceae bacterium]|nr:hypothetical protein [Bryobacteraceae bacterium]
MPLFKIHRLKDTQFQQFRWAPHTSGACQVRPKDYVEKGAIEAASAYLAWAALKDSEQALRVGDLLEDEGGGLRICKYVGFEEAHWFVPEVKPDPEAQEQVPAPETANP